MFTFKSLTSKYVFISVVLLLFVGFYSLAEFAFTEYMEGDARKINIAGRERMLTYKIASHLHFIVNMGPSAERDRHVRGAEHAMDDYEEALFALKEGSARLGVEALHEHEHDKPSRMQLEKLIELWRDEQRPVLRSILRNPDAGGSKRCAACHAAVRDNLPQVEALVKHIEDHHDRELAEFTAFRVAAVCLLATLATGLFFFTRRSLILPAKQLKAAASEIERGHFDARMEVRSSDEIGALSLAFNSMAEKLKALFEEKAVHLHELNVLNAVSRAASSSLSLEVMLGKVLDELMSLEQLNLVKKGGIFLCSEDKKSLRLLVSHNFGAEQARECGLVTIGECLCGRVLEHGEVLFSANSKHDERHDKTYPGTQPHGHIILPLRSRETILGVLCLYLPEGMVLQDTDVKLYRAITDIISVAVQNAMNHRQVAMLAHTLEANMDFIMITDAEGRILHVNPQAQAYLGYRPDEVRGKHIASIGAGMPGKQPWVDIFQKTISGGGWKGEIFSARKNGTEYPVLVTTSLVIYENENVIAFVGIARDITEHKQTTAALRHTKERYQQLFDLLPFGGEVLDAEGRIVDCSSSDTKLLGFEREELIGRRFMEFVHPDSLPLVREKFAQILQGNAVQAEIRLVRKDGRVIDVARAARPITAEDGRISGALALSVDITDRKRAEEEKCSLQSQLLQAQKLESLGRLAGGVAHDFNNLLSVILGYSDMALRRLPADSPFREWMSLIRDASQRAGGLTRQLLAFSRKQKLELKPLQVNDQIENVSKMLARMIGEDVTLELKLRSRRSVLADAGQIEQILMNLAVNARDAMPGGGVLMIETDDIYLDEGYAKRQDDVKPGEYIQLAVSDTGSGMSREVQAGIFEPFFTTKETGKGTGLGLATVYGIVKQHNGHIWVYSEEGRGTLFKIYLPAIQGEGGSPDAEGREELPRGAETVLVVDDEEAIRNLVREALQPLGYTVIDASSGAMALQLVEFARARVDVVLTDVIMPGMSGAQLAERLRALRPELQVIFMSGYTDDSFAHHGVLKEGVVLVQKPLTQSQLAVKIREVLDSRNAG